MITAIQLRDMQTTDLPAYLRECDRQLAVLDAVLATTKREVDFEIDAWIGRFDYHADFRARVEADVVPALRALGLPDGARAWRAGVIATRVWLLELASPPEVHDLPMGLERLRIPGWHGPSMTEPESPFGEWLLYAFVLAIAEGVRDERRKRKFGPAAMTAADIDVARLQCLISNERWTQMRETARWVLR
jgi:hypothetical protein